MQYYSIAEFSTSPSALSSALWQRIMTYSFVRVNFSSLRSFIDSHNTPAIALLTSPLACVLWKQKLETAPFFKLDARLSRDRFRLYHKNNDSTSPLIFFPFFFFFSFPVKMRLIFQREVIWWLDANIARYFSMIKNMLSSKMRLQKRDCFI